jgi:hypothetical protein
MGVTSVRLRVRTRNLSFVVNFRINPVEGGSVRCDGNKTENYSRFDSGNSIACRANPNQGFVFSSWSGDFVSEANRNTDVAVFDISKYGRITANFIEPPPQVSIPAEFWAPFYAVIPGFFIPSIWNSLNGRRQRKYLEECLEQIGKLDKKNMEEKVKGYIPRAR